MSCLGVFCRQKSDVYSGEFLSALFNGSDVDGRVDNFDVETN